MPNRKRYREKLESIVDRHPLIFGAYEKGGKDFDEMPPVYRAGEYYTDNWECVWYNIQEGLEGQVVAHPSADRKVLEIYQPPDFMARTERKERDWDKTKRIMKNAGRKVF